MKNALNFAISAAFMLATTIAVSCSSDDNGGSEPDSVQIGTQVWMKKNLDVAGGKCYGEGKKVYIRDDDTFANLTATEIQNNCNKHGKLYNFETAKTICPAGWQLPSMNDWIILADYIKNESGNPFYASFSGSYESVSEGGVFFDIDRTGAWWSVYQNKPIIGFIRNVSMNSIGINYEADGVKALDLHSVRCIKNN